MKQLMFVFALAIAAVIMSSCASGNKETTTTTSTTTTSHQPGTGLPAQPPPTHSGM